MNCGTHNERVVISWSSGKDSTLTLLRLLNDPNADVVGLFTTYVKGEVPFQVTPIELVQQQADAIGLPLIRIELPEIFPANDIYQRTVIEGIKNAGLAVDAVAFGDMFCNGIVDYRKSYIEPAGWRALFPLLCSNPEQDSPTLAKEILKRGIETTLVTVDTTQLDGRFCGKKYTQGLIDELPEGVDPCGEDGEFHTLVTNAPCFNYPLKIIPKAIEKGPRFWHLRYDY